MPSPLLTLINLMVMTKLLRTFCELPPPSLLLFFTYLFNFLLQMVSFLKIEPLLKSFLYTQKVIVKAQLTIGPFQF